MMDDEDLGYHGPKARDRLKSPTCADCAKAAGLIAVTEVYTMYMDTCANCGHFKGVSTALDWKRLGEKRFDWD